MGTCFLRNSFQNYPFIKSILISESFHIDIVMCGEKEVSRSMISTYFCVYNINEKNNTQTIANLFLHFFLLYHTQKNLYLPTSNLSTVEMWMTGFYFWSIPDTPVKLETLVYFYSCLLIKTLVSAPFLKLARSVVFIICCCITSHPSIFLTWLKITTIYYISQVCVSAVYLCSSGQD